MLCYVALSFRAIKCHLMKCHLFNSKLWNKARCKRVVLVVAVGGNCTRDVCSCTSLSVFVYRVRALSAATPI